MEVSSFGWNFYIYMTFAAAIELLKVCRGQASLGMLWQYMVASAA
jgi:hypothetical protein